MTKQQAIIELKKLQKDQSDVEVIHYKANAILCELLISLDCEDVVKEWEKVEKWYA